MCSGLEWSSTVPDNAQLELCAGDPVKLHWHFNLSEGERLTDVQWLHLTDDGEEEQLVANYEENNFVPTAEFSGRVSHVGDGGMELSCATIMDSGRYSVVVSTRNDVTSVSAQHRRAVSVRVNDIPKTRSGDLQIHQERKAVRDVTTGQWHVQLTCGHFSDRGHPPVDVIWKTPNGEQLTSSYFHNSSFHLLLPNPTKGGNYSCGLPSRTPATSCLPPHSAMWTDVTVEVEEVDARFLLLEAHQVSVQTQVDQEAALRVQMMDENERLLDVIDELKNETELLRSSVEAANARVIISFHARLESDLNDFVGRLHPYIVITNEGDAFSGTQGLFTAPVNGTYFFIGSAGTGDRDYYYVHLDLKMEGTSVSRAYARAYSNSHGMGACHATLRLTVGQRVWLESMTSSACYKRSSTSFSGFLISFDD